MRCDIEFKAVTT
jgi:hypothetical protein